MFDSCKCCNNRYKNYEKATQNCACFHVCGCNQEFRADILLKGEVKSKVCGEVKDQCGKPLCNITVVLYKIEHGCECEHKELACTKTDSCGRYCFEICVEDGKGSFVVMAEQPEDRCDSAYPVRPDCDCECHRCDCGQDYGYGRDDSGHNYDCGCCCAKCGCQR